MVLSSSVAEEPHVPEPSVLGIFVNFYHWPANHDHRLMLKPHLYHRLPPALLRFVHPLGYRVPLERAA